MDLDLDEVVTRAVKDALGLAANPRPTSTPTGMVLVRGDRSGLFLGEIASLEDHGRVVTLDKCRHIWSWSGALNALDLSIRGPSSGKITAPADGSGDGDGYGYGYGSGR